jgi:hypothetical protein
VNGFGTLRCWNSGSIQLEELGEVIGLGNLIDHQLKRLDHLQAIIQRLSGNSFLIKGWALTIVTAMLSLALKDPPSPAVAYLSILPTVAFWGLDGYYLTLEIGMRHLYDAGAKELADSAGKDQLDRVFRATIQSEPVNIRRWLGATLRPVTSTIYVVLIVSACAVARSVR